MKLKTNIPWFSLIMGLFFTILYGTTHELPFLIVTVFWAVAFRLEIIDDKIEQLNQKIMDSKEDL